MKRLLALLSLLVAVAVGCNAPKNSRDLAMFMERWAPRLNLVAVGYAATIPDAAKRLEFARHYCAGVAGLKQVKFSCFEGGTQEGQLLSFSREAAPHLEALGKIEDPAAVAMIGELRNQLASIPSGPAGDVRAAIVNGTLTDNDYSENGALFRALAGF